jgi:hypothetical protein
MICHAFDWFAGLRLVTLLLVSCFFAWTGWIVGHFQGRRAVRRKLRKQLRRASSQFADEI